MSSDKEQLTKVFASFFKKKSFFLFFFEKKNQKTFIRFWPSLPGEASDSIAMARECQMRLP
jgi:hypothetical protein